MAAPMRKSDGAGGGVGTKEGSQPLLQMTSKQKLETREASRKSQARTLPVDKWTNTQVVQWLLDIDQKVFLPAAITQNISGSTLLQLTREQVKKVAADSGQGEHSEATLWNHIDSLQPRSDALTWGTDANPETEGRLLSHPTGWTYDREYNEWANFLAVYQEMAITIHIEAFLKKQTAYYQVLVLMLSAVATLGTSTLFAVDEATPDGIDHAWFGKVFILLFTFLTTITSGYVQIKGPVWKEELELIAHYQDVAEKLTSLYEDNLNMPLNDRIPYIDYNMRVKHLRSSMPMRLSFSPGKRNHALINIKMRDPTVWKRGFQFMEVVEAKTGWKCWTGRTIISLYEPNDKKKDNMVMHFSRHDKGEYNTKPETYQKDRKEAQDAQAHTSSKDR